jgi:hypothetical protein
MRPNLNRHFPYDLPGNSAGLLTRNIRPPSGEFKLKNAPWHENRRWIGARSPFRMPGQPFCPRSVDSHSVAPSAFVGLSPPALGHIGAALGGIAANRRIRSRIVRYRPWGTATSASWNVTYRAWCTILLPILTSLSRNVVSVQCFTLGGSANRLRKLLRL